MRKITVLALFAILVGAAFAGGTEGKKAKAGSCSSSKAAVNASNKTTCKVTEKYSQKAWLGVKGEKAWPEKGYYTKITEVVPESPAAQAGFQVGDVILAINGAKLSKDNVKAIKAAKKTLAIGQPAKYLVKRDGEKVKLTATLSKAPDHVIAQWVSESQMKQKTEVVASN